MVKSCRIISVCALKGGVGKSTIVSNLAALASDRKHRVAILELDQQGSLEDWRSLRKNDNITVIQAFDADSLGAIVEQAVHEFSRIYIDSPPRDSDVFRIAAALPSLYRGAVLIPLVPSPVDLWSYLRMLDIIQEIAVDCPELRAYSVLNMVVAHTRLLREIEVDLRNYENIVPLLTSKITMRSTIKRTFERGLGVSEVTDKKTAVSKSEIEHLYAELENKM